MSLIHLQNEQGSIQQCIKEMSQDLEEMSQY